MNYALAKQLKDAGFPQNTEFALAKSPWDMEGRYRPQRMTRENDNNGYANLLSNGYDVVSVPTLSELIEACSDNFSALKLVNGLWIADSSHDRHSPFASIPEEAVAKLWLALHP